MSDHVFQEVLNDQEGVALVSRMTESVRKGIIGSHGPNTAQPNHPKKSS